MLPLTCKYVAAKNVVPPGVENDPAVTVPENVGLELIEIFGVYPPDDANGLDAVTLVIGGVTRAESGIVPAVIPAPDPKNSAAVTLPARLIEPACWFGEELACTNVVKGPFDALAYA